LAAAFVAAGVPLDTYNHDSFVGHALALLRSDLFSSASDLSRFDR
jgi:hypothetical protein